MTGELWPPSKWWLAMASLAIAVLMSCTAVYSTSDFDVGSGTQGEANNFPVGERVWLPAGSLRLIGGGRATLLSIDALGLSADVLVTPLAMGTSNGEIGMFPEAAIPQQFRDAARPLAGFASSAADGPVQAIAVVTVPEGGIAVHGFRLRYQRDGAVRSVFLPHSDHVCIGPSGGDCPILDVHP